MHNPSDDWIVIGRFGRAHGIKGLITVQSYTEPRDNIMHYTEWHACFNTQWKPLKIERLDVNNKSILAQIEGYQEREQVALLTNVEIGVNRQQLPVLKPGEYYWHELIGMQVVGQLGQKFGEVVEIMPTGSNDVMVVEGDKRHLLPYLPGQFVTNVDPIQRVITVDWDMDF